MATLIKSYTFSAGATILANEHNVNFDTLYNGVNGNIDNSNIVAGAGIVESKLANISTIGKVNLSALAIAGQTTGDILYSANGTTFTRLPIGTVGQHLKNGGAIVTQSDTTANISNGISRPAYSRYSQGFKVSTTDEIPKFTMNLKKSAGATGTLTGYIYSDNGSGLPNASLATFSAIAVSTLTTSFVDYEFTGTFTPTVGTQYHLLYIWTSGTDGDAISTQIETNAYADGKCAIYEDGVGWAFVGGGAYDAYFKVYQIVPGLKWI